MGGQIWEVVGGADRGGILVRTGKNTMSPPTEDRLSKGALVKEIELEGERLHYERLSGRGPRDGWVSIKLKDKSLVVKTDKVPPPQIWEAVGGAVIGGILVRDGKAPGASGLPTRLATGSLIKEVELDGDKLHYELLTGSGPPTGWVNIKFKGESLLVRTDKEPLEQVNFQPSATTGEPLKIVAFNEDKQFSYENYPLWVRESAAIASLWREKKPFFPPPEIPPARMNNMRNLYEMSMAHPFIPTPSKKLKEVSKLVEPGAFFGIDFPFTTELLQSAQFGAAWLTKAMHVAGTLPKDNMITKLCRCEQLPTGGGDCAGGAGNKAFLTVEYLKPDPELHTELFAKYPYEYDFKPTHRYFLSGQFDNDGKEVATNLYVSHLFPFRTPKVYFADICRTTTNYILITETVPFGEKPKIQEGKFVSEMKEYSPYEILPGCSKFQDYLLPDPLEYYCCIFRQMGRLAAWDKLGRFDSFFGPSITFTPEQYLQSTKDERKPQPKEILQSTIQAISSMTDKALDFVLNVAPHLFPPEVLDKKKLESMKADLMEMSPYFFDISRYYQNNDSNFIAAMHVNLQADNAYFWRDEYGDLSCGVLDWGNFGRTPFCGNFLGVLGGVEPNILLEHLETIITSFVDEYERCGGPKLAVEECIMRYHLQLISVVFDSFQWLERSVYKETPKEEFKEMKSVQDDNFHKKWNTKCYVSGVIYNVTYYLKHGGLKAVFDTWSKGVGRPYLTVYE